MQRYVLPFALVMLGATAASTAAETYQIEKSHAAVLFSVDHAGFSLTHGRFEDFDASLLYDAAKPATSNVEVTVRTNSLNSAWPARDKDVMGENFLDAAKYPEMRFVSTKVVPGSNQELRIDGDLTLHGVTKPITLNAKLTKVGPNPFDKRPMLGFSATNSLKRSDFGITNFIPVVGDEVAIKLDVEFSRPL